MPNSISLHQELFQKRLALGAILFFALADLSIRLLLPVERTFCNQGIAWGIPLPPPITIGFSFAVLIGIAFFWWREEDDQKWLGWVLVFIGGGVNTLERLLRGCVIDYLHLPLFPSFNGADMMLVLGVGVLMWSLVRHRG